MTRSDTLNLAFALVAISAVIYAWLSERDRRCGKFTKQVLGRDWHELLCLVDARKALRSELDVAPPPQDEIVRILARKPLPIAPHEFVVVPRRGREAFVTYEPWDGAA